MANGMCPESVTGAHFLPESLELVSQGQTSPGHSSLTPYEIHKAPCKDKSKCKDFGFFISLSKMRPPAQTHLIS